MLDNILDAVAEEIIEETLEASEEPIEEQEEVAEMDTPEEPADEAPQEETEVVAPAPNFDDLLAPLLGRLDAIEAQLAANSAMTVAQGGIIKEPEVAPAIEEHVDDSTDVVFSPIESWDLSI